jgi:Tfp pilus assembly protein PilV
MIDAAWLIAAVILAASVLTATLLMAVNFPRIRAAQAATLQVLQSLEEATHARTDQLEKRVAELERRSA